MGERCRVDSVWREVIVVFLLEVVGCRVVLVCSMDVSVV